MDSRFRTKHPSRVYLFPPETSSSESFANVFQAVEEQAPQLPNIAQIKRRVQQIRRSHKQEKTQPDMVAVQHNQQTHITITCGDVRQVLQVTLAKQEEDDKLAPVFSPYKEKSPEKQGRTLEPTSNWRKQSERYSREQAVTSSLEFRRRSLRSAIQPRNQDFTTPMTAKRGMSAKSSSGMKLKKTGTTLEVPAPSAPSASSAFGNTEPYYVNMSRLSDLYELLTQIALAVKNNDQQTLLLRIKMYVEYLSSGELQFLDQFVEQSEQKLRKQLQFARVMENIAVIYMVLQYAMKLLYEQQVNLLNFIGHCASNVIFLVRLYTLVCRPIDHLPQTSFETSIDRFEIAEFKELLHTPEQVGLRMQHNNEIINLLEGKIGRGQGHFSQVVRRLLKNFQRERYATSECTHYLLEYLSYHLYANNLNRRVPFLDIAPTPYLNPANSDRYTIVVQPYGILFAFRNTQTVFRPLARKFIEYLCRSFEVILWTWMMPADIDHWLNQIDPEGCVSTRLYKYHCEFDSNIYKKSILRLGRQLNRTLIVDYDHRIYAETPDNGIELGWNIQEKDQKLLDLTQILLEMRKNVPYQAMQQLEVQETLKIYNEEVCRLRYKRPQQKRVRK